MTVHIALLRGINVGRNKRIAMPRLRELMADLGYADAKTHLQSGNVVFDGGNRTSDSVAKAIEKAIATDLDMDVKVVVRTKAELAKVVKGDPFGDAATDPTRYLVTFFSGSLPAADRKAAEEGVKEPDQVVVRAREMYTLLPHGFMKRTFDQGAWEKQIKLTATSRNWRTVTKLLEIADGI